MVDLTQFATVAGLAALVGVLVQLLKPYLTQRWQVPVLAVLSGIALALAIGLALGKIVDVQIALSWLIGGFLAGVTAIGGYELTVDKLKPPSTNATDPPRVP